VADEPKVVAGDAGGTVMRNVKRIREAQRLTYVELAQRLAAIGRPIPVLGLRRIERGERRVDVDDLLALSYVLATPIVDLLLPPVDPDGTAGPVFVTPDLSVNDRDELLFWFTGVRPLEGTDEEAYKASQSARDIVKRRSFRATGFVAFLEAVSDVVGPTASRLFEELATIVGQLEDENSDVGQLIDFMDLDGKELADAIERAKNRLERKATAFDEGRGL
jgi:transcriptional regulator with XRE-family HTH domain